MVAETAPGSDLSKLETGMYVHQSGERGPEAVVFLHGVGNSGGMWRGHMDSLSDLYCLAPDLPGFGRSNRLRWESLVDVADQVAHLIERRVPGGRAHVVGLSLGGAVAHTLLGRHPDRLNRVIIDGCGVLPWWGSGLLKTGVAVVSPFIGTRPVVGTVARAWNLDAAASADLRAASPRAFRRGFADANSARLTRAELAAVCPVLLVAGEKEKRPPVRASNATLAALLPQAEARYLPGHGHGWLGFAPELHHAMVRAWIERLEVPDDLVPESPPALIERSHIHAL